MPSCVVKSCKNYLRKFKKSKGITYHKFPRNKKRKDDWVLIIRKCRGENNWDPSPASTVCSAHFDDVDLKTTAKGFRCLVPYAIPKRLLSNLPEIKTQSTSSPILQKSPDIKEETNDEQPPSSPSTISSLLQSPDIKEEPNDEQPPSSPSTILSLLQKSPDIKEEPNDQQPPSSPSAISSLLQKSPDIKEEPNDQQPPSSPSTISSLLQKSPDIKEEPNDQQPPSSPSTISSLLQVPVLTDEFALTGYCRLCAASNCDGRLLNIQSDDVLRKLVVNMSNRLNINIDFSQEHLPTTICSVCVKSLYTAYDFVVGIDLAQVTLNKISMQKYKYQMPDNLKLCNNMDLSSTSLRQVSPNIGAAESNFEQSLPFISNMNTPVPPVSSNIEVAASYFNQSRLHVSSTNTPLQHISPNTGAATSNFEQPPLLEIGSTIPFLLDTPRKHKLKDNLNKQIRIIDLQKKNIKRLNQKVRRLQNRYESHKNIIKNLKKRNCN